MKKFLLQILSFFYPVTCSLCGAKMPAGQKRRVCFKCRSYFRAINGFVCRKCGLPLDDGGEHCHVCRGNKEKFYFDRMRSAYLYRDGIRTLVLKFKYAGRIFLAADLAEGMVKVFNENDFFNDTDIIVPVPLNIFRRLKRGYNQAFLLAAEIGRHTSKPVLQKVLIRKKITKPQFSLSKEERFENIKNSFAVKRREAVKNKNILLIDDIVTTSATASACAQALKKAGCRKVNVLTLARD
jgi:ComF family protein